jgi:hypothetical protein
MYYGSCEKIGVASCAEQCQGGTEDLCDRARDRPESKDKEATGDQTDSQECSAVTSARPRTECRRVNRLGVKPRGFLFLRRALQTLNECP